MTTTKKTFWFSARDTEKRYASGWCFGETADLACANAVAGMKRSHEIYDNKNLVPRGQVDLYVQEAAPTAPDMTNIYTDFKIEIVLP